MLRTLARPFIGVLVAATTCLVAATLASCATTTAAPVVRPEAPVVPPLATLDASASFDLAQHRGSVVVLDFMSAWCEPCVHGLPAQIELWTRHRDRGVVFALVAQDPADDPELARLVEQHDVPFAVVRDPDQAWLHGFGFRAVPALVVLDADGRIALSVVDPETLEPGAVDALIEQLSAQEL